MMFFYINFSESYIKYFNTKTISNGKIIRYKVLHFVEHYNFDVDLVII